MRVKLLFSESLRSLGANLSTTIAATMTVLIGMFLLGLFIALGSWVGLRPTTQKEKLLVKVYFCTESTCDKAATPAQINAVRAGSSTPIRASKSSTFVSKAEALERMRKRSPELVENLPSNPLPPSHSRSRPVTRAGRRRRSAASLRAALPPGVEKVRDGEETPTGSSASRA